MSATDYWSITRNTLAGSKPKSHFYSKNFPPCVSNCFNNNSVTGSVSVKRWTSCRMQKIPKGHELDSLLHVRKLFATVQEEYDLAEFVCRNPWLLDYLVYFMRPGFLSKTSLQNLFKTVAAERDPDLTVAFARHWGWPSWKNAAVQWKFSDLEMVPLLRFLAQGSKKLRAFVRVYPIIAHLHFGLVAGWKDIPDGNLTAMLEQARRGRNSARSGLGYEDSLAAVLERLGVACRRHESLQDGHSTYDVVVGNQYVEVSVMDSDGSNMARKASCLINDAKLAREQKCEVRCLLGGMAWPNRSEYKKLPGYGVPVYTLEQAPLLICQLAESIGKSVSWESASQLWRAECQRM